jgi:predicted NAD/FAD-dependent oxidoreductase
MAGIACARTLMQAGCRVEVFEKSRGAGGRMSTRQTEFGSFDHGTQYFTVRDARFRLALDTAPSLIRAWRANTVRVMDEIGRVVAADRPQTEEHWVAAPGMNALVRHWAAPTQLHAETLVTQIQPDRLQPSRWQLHTDGPGVQSQVHAGFDAVLLAVPSVQAQALLRASSALPQVLQQLEKVEVAPCWTLMLAFPQAVQGSAFGPHWQAARSAHHRISWVARESSKPGRDTIERWTVHASPEWSQRHLEDDAERVKAKLLRGFTEVTGIRATPPHAQVHRWRHAQTVQPLGQSHLWDARSRIGLAGDWCLGRRVEDAFVSGLELALGVLKTLK